MRTIAPASIEAYDDLGTGFAHDLREVAKVIYGVTRDVTNVKARSFELSNGGYDTHSDQGTIGANDQHFQLHHEVGDAVEVFYDDCADMGVANKLCVVVWSEFARRIEQNANGTDHGSQGPMFVIGGAVKGGVYGNHPNINEAALNDDGNTGYSQAAAIRSARRTFVTSTERSSSTGSASRTRWPSPIDSGDPNQYWTAPNFDLGISEPERQMLPHAAG